jgi:hypothetical protein
MAVVWRLPSNLVSAPSTQPPTPSVLRVLSPIPPARSKPSDYMPFGEELGSGVGGRTIGMGFGATDGVRQKFTGKERDSETGLDFFQAR